jgi:hypothetical protein
VPWTDGRQEASTRAQHAAASRQRHEDPDYHRAALRGLAAGRAQRAWTEEAILQAVRDFRARTGRWPAQRDFRRSNSLPGLGTVARRYESHLRLVRACESEPSSDSIREA